MTDYVVNVQIVVTFDVPCEAATEDDAAGRVECMGNSILDHVEIRGGDVWVNSVRERGAS